MLRGRSWKLIGGIEQDLLVLTSPRPQKHPLHHWNGCINEVKVGFSERTEARFWNPRDCARRPPGWRCNSRRSGVKGCREVGLQSNKEGREGSKVFRSEALPRGIAKGPGREGSRESRDARPRRSSRDTKPGLGPSAPSSARWDSEPFSLLFHRAGDCGSSTNSLSGNYSGHQTSKT